MTILWSRDREIQDPLSMKAGSGNETTKPLSHTVTTENEQAYRGLWHLFFGRLIIFHNNGRLPINRLLLLDLCKLHNWLDSHLYSIENLLGSIGRGGGGRGLANLSLSVNYCRCTTHTLLMKTNIFGHHHQDIQEHIFM